MKIENQYDLHLAISLLLKELRNLKLVDNKIKLNSDEINARDKDWEAVISYIKNNKQGLDLSNFTVNNLSIVDIYYVSRYIGLGNAINIYVVTYDSKSSEKLDFLPDLELLTSLRSKMSKNVLDNFWHRFVNTCKEIDIFANSSRDIVFKQMIEVFKNLDINGLELFKKFMELDGLSSKFEVLNKLGIDNLKLSQNIDKIDGLMDMKLKIYNFQEEGKEEKIQKWTYSGDKIFDKYEDLVNSLLTLNIDSLSDSLTKITDEGIQIIEPEKTPQKLTIRKSF